MSKLYIYGAGGHSLVVKDIALACGYNDIEFIDDLNDTYRSFDELTDKTISFAIGIGKNTLRSELYKKVKESGFNVVTLIHPSAVVSKSAVIEEGTVVMQNVVINAKASVGKGVILNTACVVEHENIIGDFVHISPNSACAGNVIIKQNSHLGIGSCVIQGVTIGSNSVIGAGSVVVKDIGSNVLAYGSPCKEIRKIDG